MRCSGSGEGSKGLLGRRVDNSNPVFNMRCVGYCEEDDSHASCAVTRDLTIVPDWVCVIYGNAVATGREVEAAIQDSTRVFECCLSACVPTINHKRHAFN